MFTSKPLILANYLKAITDETRLGILKLLKKKELCVCEIFPELKLTQNLASHHLKVLKKVGLVKNRKEGLKVIYTRNEKTINRYQTLLSNAIKK